MRGADSKFDNECQKQAEENELREMGNAPICQDCWQLESEHALHGNWCPSNNEDQLWSTTRKFTVDRTRQPE